MRKSSSRTALVYLIRLAASLLLALPLYLYLSDIVPAWVYIAVIPAAFAAGTAVERSGLRFIPAAALLILAAVLLRAVVFLAVGAAAPSFESALLDFTQFRFDSGFLPLFPLFVYFALWTYSVLRRPAAAAAEVLCDTVIFVLLLWSQGGYRLTVFPHPGMLAAYVILFFIAELTVLTSVSEKSGTLSRIAFILIVLPLFLGAVFLFFNRYSEGASKDGGGLMQPTLFRFDFSDYVKLETEISMDNDLVLLLRNYGYLNSVYLRRFYLSGYKPERGFYLEDGPGEIGQLLTLPDVQSETGYKRYPTRTESEQEYFIVNFDPASLIAMNYPVSISPLTNWSGSSFLRNYRVVSETVEQPSWELSEASVPEMDHRLYDFYTDYGNDQRIKQLAEEVTAGLEYDYDKVIAILFYLHDNYFYSLKPGVAPDGNQLHYFMFDSRKGYCSYFAFSMALMCRSIGLPARVAAGFFVDPQSGILNVYPVREDMAHAWVEVAFEGFGWVEFDPTTERMAPGEELEFGTLDSSEYSELVEEIFSNDYAVDSGQPAEQDDDAEVGLASVVKRLGRLLRIRTVPAVIIFYSLFLFCFHLYEAAVLRFSSPLRRITAAYKTAGRQSRGLGFRREESESLLEFASRAESGGLEGFRELSECYLETVFSKSPGVGLSEKARKSYRRFAGSIKRRFPVKRVLMFFFPFIRFGRIRSSAVVTLLLAVIMTGLNPSPLNAQDAAAADYGTADDYLEMALKEQDSENYESALNLLNEGISLFPESPELKAAAGDLYSDRELYNLALQQYGEALELNPGDIEIMYRKSVTEGLLNLDGESIRTLEQILDSDSGHYDALTDLGWMYFKTFRLKEAESLLLGAIDSYEDSPILLMTLGTVYSGLYDYENAEKFYLKSIDMAIEKGWDYFTSVSYYNLSLLEHGFYRYKEALEYTNKSIEYGERAPGYISRAEIYLGRMDFDNAFQNYQRAYTFDSTPLALMGLADLYLTFGLLDEALSHINEVLKHDDDSWMYYFGVDPARHRMETDRLLMEIYRAMAVREKKSPGVFAGRLSSAVKRIRYSVLGWYHGRRYRNASFEVGQSNERQGNGLDAAWAYYVANEDYPDRAERYLFRARRIETEAAPAAEASYLLETGILEKDASLISDSLELLDPEWELRQISEAVSAMLEFGSIDRTTRNILAEQLYRINPGAFIANDFNFPILLDYNAGFLMKRQLRRSGFDLFRNNSEYSYRYRLGIADNGNGDVLYSVTDFKTGIVIVQITVDEIPDTPKKVSDFCSELKKRLFSISDGKDGPL